MVFITFSMIDKSVGKNVFIVYLIIKYVLRMTCNLAYNAHVCKISKYHSSINSDLNKRLRQS